MTRRMFGLYFVFLQVCFCFTAPCLAQTRDFWLKTQRKGTDFASEHIIVRTLENGGFEYRLDSHTKMDVLAVKQDIIQMGVYIVDENLSPLSFDVHTTARATDVRVTGKCADGVMHVTIAYADGEVLERHIPFENTYFAPVMADLILRREKEKSFEVKWFDPQAQIVVSSQVEVTKSDKRHVEATLTHSSTEKLDIDRRGHVNQIEFVEEHMRLYLADADSAQNIDYLDTADGLSLMVKSKKSFPNVYIVSQAQIQVGWRDIPFEEFDLEDNRQKVTRKKLNTGRCEVVLEFSKPTVASKGVKVPVDNEEFAPFLKDADFVKPNDPAIQRQMAEIKGDETDAFAITQNILKWMSDNIKTDIIAETLTGPEVLRTKRGKCSEYAILFASLARAAGIPTKLVMGETCVGRNLWGCHMWNEVWLGEWMTVDASQGRFVTDPSLVKFVDSPTVMGVQHVRSKLVDNLSLEILDFMEDQPTASTEIVTGITGNTYSSKEFSCRISAPKTGWTVRKAKINGVVPFVTIQPKSDKTVVFHLALFHFPPGTSPKTVLDARVNALSGMFKNLKRLREEEIEIAGKKGFRIVYQVDNKEKLTLLVEERMLVDGANGYLFTFDAPKDRFGKLQESVKEIYESFELVK